MKQKTAPLIVANIIALGESGGLLTEAQICAVYQISAATISRMVHANEIPYIYIRTGRRKKTVRFRWSEIQRWIHSRSRGPGRSIQRAHMVTGVALQENKSPKMLNSNASDRFDEPAAKAGEGAL